MMNLKNMIKDQKKVHFSFYRDMELWYMTEDGFEFPVPIKEVGNATFMAQDKAILFMRYIRKHMEMLGQARKEQGEVRGCDTCITTQSQFSRSNLECDACLEENNFKEWQPRLKPEEAPVIC